MRYNISKELFEAVRKDVNGIVSIDCSEQEIDNYFRINYKKNFGLFNYDEFFFDCKEWAFNNGFEIASFKANHSGFYFATIQDINPVIPKMPFSSSSEQQAVFDACEWIRKELLK